MALGLAWFVAAAALTLVNASVLAYPHSAPPVVALAHAWVLGFCVTVAVGAIYQLAPVALGTTLVSERSAWAHLGFHGVGVPALVAGFWRWDFLLLGGGALLVLAGVVLFAVNSAATIRRSGKRDAVAWSLLLATAWLLVTATVGLLLVANRAWGWWALDSLSLLRAHAHLGLIGFFLTLLQGVTFRLVPMFTLGDVPDWRPVKLGLAATQLALVVLAPALAWHRPALAVGAGALLFAGVIASGIALRQTLATRKKRALDNGLRALLRGCAGLLAVAAAALWLEWPTTSAGSAPGGLSGMVYGIAILAGVLLPAIAGMMGKIVPFLTWMRAYGPLVGRAVTPPATALSHAGLDRTALHVLSLAALPLLIGAWTLVPAWLFAGAAVLAAAAVLFAVSMAIVLKHLWRPVVTLPAAGKSSP